MFCSSICPLFIDMGAIMKGTNAGDEYKAIHTIPGNQEQAQKLTFGEDVKKPLTTFDTYA